MLTLTEELLLLGLHDDKGSVVFNASTGLPYGLAGTVLMDLLYENRISLINNIVKVTNESLIGNPVLDDALMEMIIYKKDKEVKFWVNRIHSKVKNIRERTADKLVARGILRKEEKSFLFIFTTERYPTSNPTPEIELRQRIKAVVLQGAKPSERELTIISLIEPCGLVEEIFSKEERKTAKTNLKMIQKTNVGSAVSRIVQEMTAAIVASIVATTAATTVVTSA